MKAASIHCGLDKRQEKDMPSFDIVSKTDMTSVDNALQGVVKEMQVRYDFKGSKSEISKEGEVILIIADDELKRRQVEELLQS